MKFNLDHFSTKNMTIGDIDLHTPQQLIRCSTPTHSHDGSTILAGNLDWSDDATEDFEDENEVHNNDIGEILQPYVDNLKRKALPVRSKLKEPNYTSSKNTYCSNWMKTQDGVSTENTDIPPSIYDSSVDFSNSLLDITSISHNLPQQAPKKSSSEKICRGINKICMKHENTKFM